MRVSKLEQDKSQTPQDVAALWHTFHSFTMDLCSDVVSAERYALFTERTRRNPMFIMPVFKSIGYMNLLVQFQPPYTLLTSLREYKSRGHNASTMATFAHYTELAKSKKIVLVRGEVANATQSGESINKGEASMCMSMVRRFYLDNALYEQFVEAFNHRPHEFKFELFLEAYRAIQSSVEKELDEDSAAALKKQKRILTDKGEVDKLEEERQRKHEESFFKDVFGGKFAVPDSAILTDRKSVV